MTPQERFDAVAGFGFLRRHSTLLGDVPAWTLRLVLVADFHADRTSCDAFVSRDLQAVLGAVGGEHGRVEWQVLTAKYGHLSPLVADPSESAGGVEEGEQVGERPSARPQPPLATPPSERVWSLDIGGHLRAATGRRAG